MNINEFKNCIMSDLIPISKFNDYYDYPTKSAIRQLIFKDKNNQNGFRKVVVKIGNRQYINITAFNQWVKEQNQYGGLE